MKIADIPSGVLAQFRQGCVIPAMPLALRDDGSFDERSQRALLRYYVDAGAGGLAVGVHSTQFAIRDIPGFLRDLLGFASEVLDDRIGSRDAPFVKIAGVSGRRSQALAEASMAVEKGYHAGLLSLRDLKDRELPELLDHARSVAEVIPIIGFYLQPAVGGAFLGYEFWREFAAIDNVLGIKIAPFDRYATMDVLRGTVDSGRDDEIFLYTGNDDSIVEDLITPFRIRGADGSIRDIRIVGGLLGHWGVWTSSAVTMFRRLKALVDSGGLISPEILTLAREVTDMNAAVFDVANGFAGCIPGINEVLHRQGLTDSSRCLKPDEVLSPGQSEEIDRVCRSYPHLTDDQFIRDHLSKWRT